MNDRQSSRTGYTMGYDEDFRQMLDRRSAETHARHLLPHLRPGMRMLDVGCGPGTISVGLARTVAPGELVGIDVEQSQIDLAQAAATAGGHTNARFRVADITALPFADNSFDVAHCHAVLNHVPDTQAALREVRRVLKPGAIISCREFIGESSFNEPDHADFRAAWTVFIGLMKANGGHPDMGKQLKPQLVAAGFADITFTASFEVFNTPEDIAFFHSLVVDWFFSPKIIAAATGFGLATHDQFEQWRKTYDDWREAPRAVGAIAFGEAIAFNP